MDERVARVAPESPPSPAAAGAASGDRSAGVAERAFALTARSAPACARSLPVDADELSPEAVSMRERLVVAPCAGRFEPLPPEVFTTEGEWVEPGQVLARVRAPDGDAPVSSPFRGWVMGMLCLPGQPVRRGEALFWIWSC